MATGIGDGSTESSAPGALGAGIGHLPTSWDLRGGCRGDWRRRHWAARRLLRPLMREPP